MLPETHVKWANLLIKWSFLYLPQSSCSLLLVDVDKVAHHTALDHISLSLHANLEGQTEVMSINLILRQWNQTQPVQNVAGPPSQAWGSINHAPIGMQRQKKLGGNFGKQDVLKSKSLFPGILRPLLDLFSFIIAAVYFCLVQDGLAGAPRTHRDKHAMF